MTSIGLRHTPRSAQLFTAALAQQQVLNVPTTSAPTGQLADLDTDYDRYPKLWVIGFGRGPSPTPPVRRGLLERTQGGRAMLCSPRPTIRRRPPPSTSTPGTRSARRLVPSSAKSPSSYTRAQGQQQQLRSTSKADVRLVKQFTADVQGSSPAERARVMAAVRQWGEDTIKSALDPDWDRRAFFEHVGADCRITEWASKISTSMEQRYICKKTVCQAVVDNKRWLQKISADASIKQQHGLYVCPRCLSPYTPWIQQPDLVPAQKALVVAAPSSKDLVAATGVQRLPQLPINTAGIDANYFLYLTEREKKDEPHHDAEGFPPLPVPRSAVKQAASAMET